MLSQTEENYLKTLFGLSFSRIDKSEAGTNELAMELGVKPATANEMLKKLKEKKWVSYEKYGKISLTPKGKELAIQVVRKHRLWETFLHDKLEFTWDEVHDAAEQLEHVNSSKLIERLEKFLGYPKFDPHGDPIPNAKGEMVIEKRINLAEMNEGETRQMVAVKDNSIEFLQYVKKLGLKINSLIKVLEKEEYDDLIKIEVSNKQHTVSKKFAENILLI